jgi:hypothetical protein
MSLLLHVFDSATNQWVAATSELLNSVKAVGFQATVSASFTRPSDTTAYAAGDAVSNATSSPTILTFSGASRAASSSGMILSARHIKNNTTAANFRLWLYRDTVAAVNDNAQFALLWANRANRIGFIDFAHTTGGTGSDSSSNLATFVNLPFSAAGTALFGQLTTTGGYTPASGEQHFIELSIAQN